MKLLTKKNCLIILISIIVVFIGYYYFVYIKNQEIQEKEETSIYTKIQKDCPGTDTISIRQCTYDFLNRKEKEASTIYNSLVTDVKTNVQNNINEEDSSNETLKIFLDKLGKYNTERTIYSKALCDLDGVVFEQGTAQSEMIAYCKIKELEDYILKLENYREIYLIK